MQVRVNIRTIKQLVWLLCALMFLYAGWTFYDIYTAKVAGDYNPRKASDFEEMLKRNVSETKLVPRTGPFYQEDRYKQLWDALVDGTVRQKADEGGTEGAKPEPPAFVLPELGTILDVGLVVYSKNPIDRFVGISYVSDAGRGPGGGPSATGGAPTASTEGKQSRLHLSEGDPLKPPYDVAPYSGKVLHIGLQDVVFQWGDQEVVLTPGLGTTGDGVTLEKFRVPPEEDPSAAIVEAPEVSQEVKPGHWVMGTKELKRMKEDPQTFLSEEINVRSVTAPDGGRTQLEITEVKAGSLAAQYGAQPGDKIISVNGFPMSSLSAAISWAKANPDLPTYTVVYESKGQIKTITLHVK